ncbi:hypothetical protein ACFW0P_18030 [Lysobacter soli]|uniref:hypothetical protein n=1 Tax=Lysobacter soli TaxID=453783 RepID=UPI00368C7CC8
MKKRVIQGVRAARDDEGFVFFAESVDEMLYDYTLDTYKPSTHNASTLAHEVARTIEDIEEGRVDKGHLPHLIEELRWMIGLDATARKLLAVDHESLLSECSSDQMASAKAKVSLVQSALAGRLYLNACVRTLQDLVPVGREKKEVWFTTRQWITSLLWANYTRRFIREKLVEHFFTETAAPPSCSQRFHGFLESFDFKKRNYVVVFATSKLFWEIKKSCRDMGAEISQAAPQGVPAPQLAQMRLSEGRVFVSINSIEARDPYAARKQGEEFLSRIADIFSVFHHREALGWSDAAWVSADLPSGEGALIGNPVDPVARVSDSVPVKSARLMHKAVMEFQLQEEALDQFNRVVSLHGAAIRSKETNIQLLNLWSALEAMVPACISGAKVKSVISALSPFVQLAYPIKLVDDVVSDIYSFDSAFWRTFLKSGEKLAKRQSRRRLVEILLVPEFTDDRVRLLDGLARYPLLHNRCHVVAERMKSAADVRRMVESHERKVSWQVRRIYRTRNMYIHSGKRVVLMDTLVENAHHYLDIYLDAVQRLSELSPSISTLDQAWLVASERMREWMAQLNKKEAFDASNVSRLVLGPIGDVPWR